MSELFSYQCPSCAGRLRLDRNLSVFNCDSCGGTFDYDYFKEDELLEKAEQARLANEYITARKFYDFLLTKEPHNIAAIRGIMLCDIRANSIGKIRLPDYKLPNKIDWASYKKRANNEYDDYFDRIKNFTKVKQNLANSKEALVSEEPRKNQLERDMAIFEEIASSGRTEYENFLGLSNEMNSKSLSSVIRLLVMLIIFGIVLIVEGLKNHSFILIVFGVILLLIAILPPIIIRLNTKAEARKNFNDAQKRYVNCEHRISDLTLEIEKNKEIEYNEFKAIKDIDNKILSMYSISGEEK